MLNGVLAEFHVRRRVRHEPSKLTWKMLDVIACPKEVLRYSLRRDSKDQSYTPRK